MLFVKQIVEVATSRGLSLVDARHLPGLWFIEEHGLVEDSKTVAPGELKGRGVVAGGSRWSTPGTRGATWQMAVFQPVSPR